MRLKHCAIKPRGSEFHLYHLRSSFQAELDANALEFLHEGLRNNGRCTSNEQEEMFKALDEMGLLESGEFIDLDIRPATQLVKVEVEVTNACQIRCLHCFVAHASSYLPFSTLKKFALEARQNGAISFTFNGGEATLHPAFMQMVEYVAGIGLRPRLFTNALSITPKLARDLRSLGLSRAIISLETFREFHEWLRGEGTWEPTLKGIEAFLGEGVEVMINPIITQNNLNLMDDFTTFAIDRLGATAIEYGVVAPLGAALKNWQELALDPADFPKVFQHGTGNNPMPADCTTLFCKAGVSQLFLDVFGKVFPCHFFAFPDFVLGDAAQQALSEYYGPQTNVGKLFWEFPHDRLETCQKCCAKEACAGGCRGRAYQLSGLYSIDAVSCPKFLGTPLKF